MAATFISIMLLMVARHHPPSRRKIKEIWHGRVYWEGESNTTMLRSSPEKVTEVRESSTNLDKFTPPKITVTPPGQHLCWNAGNVFVTGHKAFDRTVSDYGGSRIIKFPKGTIPLKVKWEQHATIAWFTCEGHPYHFLHETLGPIVASLSGHEGPTRILVFSDAKVDSLKLMSERTFCHADHLLNMLLAWSQIRTDLWTTNGYSSIHSLKPNTESRDLSEVTCFRKWDVVKPNKWPTDMLPTVLRWAGCVSRNNRRRVVIIQRAHRGRKITNIDAIVQMYGDMVGFNSVEVVQFETLTLKEQLLKFCGSHILLVGIHGGGLAWGSLLGSQSSLIEIGYKEWGRASKPQYASRYKGQFILAGNPVKKSGNPKFYNISVNVKKLRKESMMILDIHPTKRVVTPSVQLEDARSPMQKAQPHLKTKTMIAICAATHSKSNWRSLDDTALQNILIPSIEKTISTSDRSKYDFRLYLAADHDDHFWLQNQNNVKTPDWLQVEIGFYEVPEQKIPFNPMMRAAFNDGAEYLVRINDDSEFVTSDWVSKAAAKLASYDPPNVGMVGPNCREGNTAIMTHDMVHRTHLDIFEHYYPDVFSAWWIDDWISKVYGPERSTKMMDWTVKHHTHKHGTRYEVQHHEANLLKGELKKGAAQIEVWLSKTDKPTLTNHPLSSLQKCTPKSNVPYRSQSNEDKAIIEQLYGGRPKCGGTIVEIGALDGVRYSNSWYFEHALQWKALLIEANPTNFKALETNRPNAINIHSAMCMGESIDFIGGGAVGGMVNTMSEKHGKKWVNPMEKSVSVPCQTFKPLFSKHGIIHVDIFILDVEGGEFEVLKTMDWSVTVGVWVVELDSTNPQKNHDVRKELRKHGYTPATWNIRDWCSKGGDCTANEVFVPLVSRPGKATCSKYSPSSKHAPSRYIWDANIEMIESSFYSPPIAVSKWSMDSHLLSALSKNHRIAYKEIVSSYQQANFDQKITALGKDFSHQRVATIKNAACDTSGLVVDSDNCLVFRNGGCDINKNSKFLIKDNAPKYDKVITIAMPWGSEPWHFVGEALVGLAYVQNIETYKIHVTAKTKFVLEWLRVVGVQEHQIITGTIFAKTLLIPELGKCGNPAPQQILWLQEKINSYLPDDGQDKHVLIVKRTKSRTQTNWADILNAAKQISPNVVVHDDSRLPSVQQQLENFRNAHTVIAPHGAGLLNIWASHPNTKVIEFMDASNMNLCYARLAYILGLNYNAIEMKSSMNRVSEVFQENAISHKISPQITNNFQIHVLTMNRATSLQRLLVSLENSEYGGENVDLYIHIDKSNDNQGCIRVAESFDFSHGDVTIEVAEQNSGLRDSWFNAWYPKEEERAVIFEDDMEVSPLWFKWLNKAWDAYSDRKDLAGISLQIQTLKAKNPHHNNWNPGSKGAFLYRIPGSWGFSPHPIQWKSFLDWIRAQDLNTLDVSTPGLITSDWWQKLDHRGMWTQYYIYFCVQHDLFTLYANLPERKTLTAHWREKGVHTPTSSGIDFPLASKVTFEFPSKPQKYDWDGEAIEEPVSRTTKPTHLINVVKSCNVEIASTTFVQNYDVEYILSVHTPIDKTVISKGLCTSKPTSYPTMTEMHECCQKYLECSMDNIFVEIGPALGHISSLMVARGMKVYSFEAQQQNVDKMDKTKCMMGSNGLKWNIHHLLIGNGKYIGVNTNQKHNKAAISFSKTLKKTNILQNELPDNNIECLHICLDGTVSEVQILKNIGVKINNIRSFVLRAYPYTDAQKKSFYKLIDFLDSLDIVFFVVGQQKVNRQELIGIFRETNIHFNFFVMVAHGREKGIHLGSLATKPTLVVTGMTRNDYKHQDATIKTIKRQMNHFDVIKVIIYENDSTDNTLNGLNTWSELLNIPVQIITQTNLKGSRTERFATGRNALIKAVEKISPEPDYMLLIDMDGVSDDLEGVETCFDLPEKWGVCCTNQRDVYYDLWVLRTFDNWCDCDVWYDSKCAVDRNAKFKYIPPSSPPIRVKSCFGGAALYNYKRKVKELIDKGAHYEADPVGHVFFHKSLRELDNDLELYIQPKMLNTAPVEHIPAPVRKREMKKKENFNTVPQTSSECPNGFQYHKSPQNLKYKASLRALPPWNWDMLQKKYDKKCQTQTSVKSQSDSIHLLSPLTDVVEKIKAASPTCKGGNCNNFLAIEVGTMFGTGTTKHLYQAISKTYNEFQLWTYEGMTERFCIAQNNLKELKHIYIVNELVMRNNILTCMVMPETGTVLSKPGGPSYSETVQKNRA